MKKLKFLSGWLSSNKVLVENFSYITLLEFFLITAPLITYPYLVRVLGMELYGIVITAQVLASYASKIIDFGSNSVCAKHVSINRNDKEKLSEIVCSVFVVRSFLWLVCLFIYFVIVLLVPSYRAHFFMFALSYGLTLNEVLFPQYFFQGIEKMKYSTLINIGIKTLFIVMIFVIVKTPEDYFYVPALYAIGYCLAGVMAFMIIFRNMGVAFRLPKVSQMIVYVKDSSAIFATDLICTIKDKLNYFFIGGLCHMSSVVVYDLGLKINTLLVKPVQVVATVLFPRFAKSRNKKAFSKVLILIGVISIASVAVTNVFLPWIVKFFVAEEIDLIPIRIFTLAPIFLSMSSLISSNLFVAFGYNKFVLYSIIITTIVYLISIGIVLITHTGSSVYSFILVALASYIAEFLYRAFKANQILKEK